MRTQIWIVAGAFAVFGAIAWAFTFYSPAYVGLIGIGIVGIILGFLAPK